MLRAGRSSVVALAAAGCLLASQVGSGAVERLQVAPGAMIRTQALPGCSKDASIRTASAVIAAFNRGDAVALNRLVAPEPAFEWFSAGGPNRNARRLGSDADNRSTLGAYVRQRHRHHERWTAVSLLLLRLTRVADDMPRRTENGKYEATCRSGHASMSVWSV
jgi:hypothetical protein